MSPKIFFIVVLTNSIFNHEFVGFSDIHLNLQSTGTKPTYTYIYALLDPLILTKKNHKDTQVSMFGGSFSRKGFNSGGGKGDKKGPPIEWEGSLGPDYFREAVFEFLVESSDFTNENSLREYDNCK